MGVVVDVVELLDHLLREAGGILWARGDVVARSGECDGLVHLRPSQRDLHFFHCSAKHADHGNADLAQRDRALPPVKINGTLLSYPIAPLLVSSAIK